MAVTRRQFMKVSAAGLAASSVGALGFLEAGDVLAAGVRPFRLEKATETRNACPYCAVACGVLIYSMADGTGKDAKHEGRPYRGRFRSPRQSRHALPARRGVARLRAQRQPPEVPDAPQAGLRQVRARELGLRDGSHRQADEGRPRQELHRQEPRWRHGQPLAQHRLLRRLLAAATRRATSPTSSSDRPGYWPSRTKHEFDTVRRWPVLAPHSDAAR